MSDPAGRPAVRCRWGDDAGFLMAICAAIWLFFYYVPAHGEGPKIEDSVLYSFCAPPIRDPDLEWITKELAERRLKPSTTGRWCGTLLGADLRWLMDELRKRGYDSGQLASPFLLPSQEGPNFFNRRICRDHRVMSGLLTAAINILKTKVTIAGSDGPNTEHDPDDVHLEAVSILGDGKAAIFCSVTVSAKGITERIVYTVEPDGAPGSYGSSWVLKFGGDLGQRGGVGRKLFPGTIQVRPPSTGPSPRPASPG